MNNSSIQLLFIYLFYSQIILTFPSFFEIVTRKPSVLANLFEDRIVRCSGDLWIDRSLKRKKSQIFREGQQVLRCLEKDKSFLWNFYKELANAWTYSENVFILNDICGFLIQLPHSLHSAFST